MNKSKIFLTSVLLITSTAWGQPDEYINDVEDSPTSKVALFDDSSEKPVETFVAAADPAVTGEATAVAQVQAKTSTRARKATRGIASVAPAYDCTAATQKINSGEKLSKQEMSTYKKNCK